MNIKDTYQYVTSGFLEGIRLSSRGSKFGIVAIYVAGVDFTSQTLMLIFIGFATHV